MDEKVTLTHPYVIRSFLAEKWAITPDYYNIIAEAIRGNGDIAKAEELRASAISNDTQNVDVINGVAVIPMIGPIVPRASMFSKVSGAASTTGMMKDFAAAMADPKVKAIVFEIASPGGAVAGIAELASMIYAGRGKKPIKAFVRGDGASAAYWLASACDEIIIGEGAILGSIGVMIGYVDRSKQDEKDGIKNIDIVSSVSPKKRLEPNTKEGLAEYQALVDDLADVMVASIARNRGIEPDAVVSGFGEGFVFVGQKAINAKMADRIDTMENLLTSLSKTQMKGIFRMDAESQPGVAPKAHTQAELDAAVAAATASATAAALVAERSRIAAIDAIKAPGFETLIAEHRGNPEMTAERLQGIILSAKLQQEENDAIAAGAAAQGAGEQPTPKDKEQKAKALATLVAEGANASRTAQKRT